MTTQLTHQVHTYTVKETAAALRKHLKAQWPNTKFSVRMARGTAYGWLHVSYTDGPTETQVTRETHKFQSSHFDGMDDSYHRIDPTLWAETDGTLVEHRYDSCGINVNRDASQATEEWAASVAVRGSQWWPLGLEAWRDNAYYSTRELIAGTDLTNGYPADPTAAYQERWNR